MQSRKPILRHTLVSVLAITAGVCTPLGGQQPSAGAPDPRGGHGGEVRRAFRVDCRASESVDYGTRTAAALRGSVWISQGDERAPLEDVQIAARSLATHELRWVTSDENGAFAFEPLENGEYDVWTCFNDFDEVRFRLIVDPHSAAQHLTIYLGPSEAMGRRDVIAGDEDDDDGSE